MKRLMLVTSFVLGSALAASAQDYSDVPPKIRKESADKVIWAEIGIGEKGS